MLDEIIQTAATRSRLPSASVRRALREDAGLTQQEVATILGVSRAAVSRYEAGDRNPRGDRAVLYVELLDRLSGGFGGGGSG